MSASVLLYALRGPSLAPYLFRNEYSRIVSALPKRGRQRLTPMSKTKLWATTKLLVVVLVSVVGSHASPILADDASVQPTALPPVQAESEKDLKEILWLARAVYSESKLAQDQRLVACAVRYRVESGKWGDEYQDVVLAKSQFSGLHPYVWNAQYAHNISRTFVSTGDAWKSAVIISKKVYYANSVKDACPELPANTMHFYSPQSITQTPLWAHDEKLVYSAGTRFAFYANVN